MFRHAERLRRINIEAKTEKKNTAGEERSGVKSAIHTPTGLIRLINIFVVSSTASFISTGDD
jgi:hypothetical protein